MLETDAAVPPTPSAPAGLSRVAILTAAVVGLSAVVSHVFGRQTYSILLPAIKEDLIDSFTGAGFLGATNFVGYMVGVVFITFIAGRVEPMTLLRIGVLLAGMGLLILSLAISFGELAVGVALAGLGGAGIWIAAPSIVTAAVPAERRGAVLGSLTASMGIGLLIVSQGTTAFRAIADDDGAWRPIFRIEACVALVAFALAVLVLKPSRTEQPDATGVRAAVASLQTIPRWRLLTVGYTSFSILAGSWSQFLATALEQDAGFTRAHINNLFSLFAVGGILGPLILGRVSDQVGRDRAIALAALLTAIASALLTTGMEPWTGISTMVFGAGSFAVPTLTAAAVRDHLDARQFSSAFGAMTIIYGLGMIVSAQLAGVIADAAGGFDLVYWILGGFALFSAVTAFIRSGTVAPSAL